MIYFGSPKSTKSCLTSVKKFPSNPAGANDKSFCFSKRSECRIVKEISKGKKSVPASGGIPFCARENDPFSFLIFGVKGPRTQALSFFDPWFCRSTSISNVFDFIFLKDEFNYLNWTLNKDWKKDKSVIIKGSDDKKIVSGKPSLLNLPSNVWLEETKNPSIQINTEENRYSAKGQLYYVSKILISS